MNWLEWACSPLIFEPTAIAFNVMPSMAEKRAEAAIVTSDGTTKGQYLGLIWAKDLVKRKIDQKQTIKKFIRTIKPVAPDTPLTDIINAILINDYPAIPIKNDKILRKIDLLKYLISDMNIVSILAKKRASEIMKVPFCITDNDSIATAMSIIRDTGVERIVVVDSKGKLVGLVDELDLFKAQSTDRFRVRGGPVSVKPTTSIGELSGEKYKMRLISIAGLVRKSIPIVKQNYSIQKVIEAMIEKELPVAVVIEKEKPIGIITTKPILRLIGRPLEGILVQLSGIQQEDIYMKAIIDEQIVNAVRKWAKFVPIKHIAIHIDRYQSTGKRIKYSIKARLIGYKGMWFADDHAWDITKAMRGVLTKLEQEILKSKSKAETRTRGPTVHFTEMPSL